MAPDPFRFDRFVLDLADRRLTRDGAAVALNARYFDALALLVREHGQLVSKDRFLDEVWRGVPVTDEALTQCVRTLRKAPGRAGVAFGIAAAELTPGRPWWRGIFGGAVGGLAVGTAVKLVGLDAFALLFGRAPVDITGGGEGAMLGGAAGLAITLLGGRLMGGSLDLLASSFPDSRLRLGRIGDLLGEPGFGSLAQALTGAAEGALFAGCIVGAMRMAGRAAAGPVTRP